MPIIQVEVSPVRRWAFRNPDIGDRVRKAFSVGCFVERLEAEIPNLMCVKPQVNGCGMLWPGGGGAPTSLF